MSAGTGLGKDRSRAFSAVVTSMRHAITHRVAAGDLLRGVRGQRDGRDCVAQLRRRWSESATGSTGARLEVSDQAVVFRSPAVLNVLMASGSHRRAQPS